MGKVVPLAASFLREHPVRVLLTSLATIAATCMVIWVASSYDALVKTFDDYAHLAFGRYMMAIAPITSSAEAAIPDEVVNDLRADPAFTVVDPMLARRVPVHSEVTPPPESGPPGDGPRKGFMPGPLYGADPHRPELMILGTDSAEPPFAMAKGRWLDPATPETMEVAVRKDIAEKLDVQPGDEVIVEGRGETLRLKVTGVVEAPSLRGAASFAVLNFLTPSAGELFVTQQTARKILGPDAKTRLVGVSLAPNVDLTKTRFQWAPRLNRYATPVQFQEAFEIEEALDQSQAAYNVRLQGYAATAIALIVGFLVVFCTLSMGVSERIRQFAILRAITFTRGDVVLLVMLEGLFLATLGFVGGLLLSYGLLSLVAGLDKKALHHGMTIGSFSLMLAVVATYGAAIVASIFPAWRASRVKPADAMVVRSAAGSGATTHPGWLIAGLVLIAVNPLLTFAFPPQFDSGIIIRGAIGFLSMTLGFLLITPSLVILVDRLVSPVLAILMGLDPKLLKSQITSHVGRTAGAAISMAIGLGLYIAIQVWGYTMLEAFIPGPWVPDTLISFKHTGIPEAQGRRVAQFEGVDPDRCLPIVVEQPRLHEDVTHSADRASVTRQDNVVIVGLDAAKAFVGEKPLLKVRWVEGSPEKAADLMRNERGCVVPDHFLTESGLKLGDEFQLDPPESPGQSVKYRIAGAIEMPGWHWLTKMTGFRSRSHRAAALMFADYDTVAKDFSLPAASYVWLSYRDPSVDPHPIAVQAQTLYAEVLGQEVTIDRAKDGGPTVTLYPVAKIRNQTLGAAHRWLWVISQIPLIALAISGFGVANVILASVRSRRWEFGVLRSIGFAASEVARAVFAEGLLIGIVALLLSFGFGILSGWCGCGLAQYLSFFGGLHPDLVLPMMPLLAGAAALLLLAGLASLGPAIFLGRIRPLKLLQGGLEQM